MSLRMLTITFKLFTSHAPTLCPRSQKRPPCHRHICYSLNFYDDGARHGFPLTLPPLTHLPPPTALQEDQEEPEVTRTGVRLPGEQHSHSVLLLTLTMPIYEFHLKFTLTFIKATK